MKPRGAEGIMEAGPKTQWDAGLQAQWLRATEKQGYRHNGCGCENYRNQGCRHSGCGTEAYRNTEAGLPARWATRAAGTVGTWEVLFQVTRGWIIILDFHLFGCGG